MIYAQKQIDNEDESDDELIVIGLTVDDDANTIMTSKFGEHFPIQQSTVSGGNKYVVLIPDSGLDRLYSSTQVEVHHTPAEIADCLLSGNYLSGAVFGQGADADLRARVFDALEMEDSGIQTDSNSMYRERLMDIAGTDEATVEEREAETRSEAIAKEYKYTELQSKAKELGIEDARQSKDALAEYIASNEE